MEQVRPGLFKMTVPTTFPVGPVNAYLLTGEVLTLVDGGPKYPEAEAALRKGLREAAGVEFSDIEQIVITHAHVDHYGLAGIVKSESKARLLCHPYEATRLAGVAYYEGLAKLYRECTLTWGFTAEEIDPYVAGFPRLARFVDPVAIDHAIDVGDVVRMGDTDFRVIQGAGHARGHLAFYDQRESLIIAGDFLLPRVTPNPVFDRVGESGLRFRALPAHAESLQAVERLPSATVCPGHGDVQDDHRRIVRFNFRHYGIRKQRILDMVTETPRQPRWIMDQLFPNITIKDAYLAISETMGHIDLLEQEGKAAMVDRGGNSYCEARASQPFPEG